MSFDPFAINVEDRGKEMGKFAILHTVLYCTALYCTVLHQPQCASAAAHHLIMGPGSSHNLMSVKMS